MKVRITEPLVVFGGRLEGEFEVIEEVQTNDGPRLLLKRDGYVAPAWIPWECVEIVDE